MTLVCLFSCTQLGKYKIHTQDGDVDGNGVLAMSVLGLEHILAGHVSACLKDEHLGVVACGVHSHCVCCNDFLLERKEDLGVLCVVCRDGVSCVVGRGKGRRRGEKRRGQE